MHCLMDHIVLNVEDDSRMIDFYVNVLHLQPERLEAYRAGTVPFPSVRLNADTIIDFFPKRMWQKTAPGGPGRVNMNHFCLALTKADWQALRGRLEGNAVELIEGPVPRWGAHGQGISIYFSDPEGTVIEARYYEDTTTPTGECLLGS